MADNKTRNTETMQREQKPGSAGSRTPAQSKSEEDRREQARLDKEGREKSAIGGGEKGSAGSEGKSQSGQPGQGSQTGEPGRGRSELDQNREFDKSRSEPTSR